MGLDDEVTKGRDKIKRFKNACYRYHNSSTNVGFGMRLNSCNIIVQESGLHPLSAISNPAVAWPARLANGLHTRIQKIIHSRYTNPIPCITCLFTLLVVHPISHPDKHQNLAGPCHSAPTTVHSGRRPRQASHMRHSSCIYVASQQSCPPLILLHLQGGIGHTLNWAPHCLPPHESSNKTSCCMH